MVVPHFRPQNFPGSFFRVLLFANHSHWNAMEPIMAQFRPVCVCCRPPARGVYPNYEVVEFEPRKVTPTEPRICRLLLRTVYLSRTALPSRRLMSFRWGQPPPAPTPPSPTSVVTPHRIIRPPGRHLSPSHHTYVPLISPILICP